MPWVCPILLFCDNFLSYINSSILGSCFQKLVNSVTLSKNKICKKLQIINGSILLFLNKNRYFVLSVALGSPLLSVNIGFSALGNQLSKSSIRQKFNSAKWTRHAIRNSRYWFRWKLGMLLWPKMNFNLYARYSFDHHFEHSLL